MDDASLNAFQLALLRDDPVALYQRAPCGFVSTTPDGTITKVNQTFLAWSGYEREELEGTRTFAQLLTGGGRIYHETHFVPTLHMEGSANEVAFDIVRADGARLPVLVNSVLERDGEGHPVVIRTAIFDATERRSYEGELLLAKQRAEASEAAATRLAQTLQQTLIPPALPEIPGLDLAAEYRPSGRGDVVGGDFYDVFQVGTDDWVVALGDVCGKGPDAAVMTALVRHTVRAAAVRQRSPSEVLAVVNDVILGEESDRFCTLVVVRLARASGRWTATVSVGGHPLPLLVPAGSAPTPTGRPGDVIGAFADLRATDRTIALEPDSLLLLYTDGVTEGRRDREFFGEARLHTLLSAHTSSAADATGAVLAACLEFQSDLPRDDIALLALRSVPDRLAPSTPGDDV